MIQIAEGDFVANRFVFYGTHLGEFRGLAPTGKQVTFEGLSIDRVVDGNLFNIDLIINRTLLYGTLTAVLAGLYFGSIVVLQLLFRALTGGGSQLAVVASTLAIAALPNP